MFSPPCWAPPRAAVARVLLAPPGPPRHLSQHACSCFPYHKEQNQQRLRRKNSVRGLPAGEEGQPEALPTKESFPRRCRKESKAAEGTPPATFSQATDTRKAWLHFSSDRKLSADPAPGGSSSYTSHTQPPWAPPRAF